MGRILNMKNEKNKDMGLKEYLEFKRIESEKTFLIMIFFFIVLFILVILFIGIAKAGGVFPETVYEQCTSLVKGGLK